MVSESELGLRVNELIAMYNVKKKSPPPSLQRLWTKHLLTVAPITVALVLYIDKKLILSVRLGETVASIDG